MLDKSDYKMKLDAWHPVGNYNYIELCSFMKGYILIYTFLSGLSKL